MNDTTSQEALEQADVPVEGDPLSVDRAFEQVTDGRHQRGVRYSVALILTLIVLATLAGMTTPLGIAEWVRLRGDGCGRRCQERESPFRARRPTATCDGRWMPRR